MVARMRVRSADLFRANRGPGDVIVELSKPTMHVLAEMLCEATRIVSIVLPPERLMAEPKLLSADGVGEAVVRATVLADWALRFRRSARRIGSGRMVGVRMKRSEAAILLRWTINNVKVGNRAPHRCPASQRAALGEAAAAFCVAAFPRRGRRPPRVTPNRAANIFAALDRVAAGQHVDLRRLPELEGVSGSQLRGLSVAHAWARWLATPEPGPSLADLLQLSE